MSLEGECEELSLGYQECHCQPIAFKALKSKDGIGDLRIDSVLLYISGIYDPTTPPMAPTGVPTGTSTKLAPFCSVRSSTLPWTVNSGDVYVFFALMF